MHRSSLDGPPGGAPGLREYAQAARELLDPALWPLVSGGSDGERAEAADQRAFERVRLRRHALSAGGRRPDTSVKLLDHTWSAPVAVAPLAGQSLLASDGDLATVRAAGAAGLPVVVSSCAARTAEELAEVATAPLWLQTYGPPGRTATERAVARAADAGFGALLLDPWSGGSALPWLRTVSPLPVLVRGIVTAADALRALDEGADGIVVARPAGGGRQAPVSALAALPRIAAAVAGRCPVLFDGAVRGGADVLAALALGADAVLLGRPVLHGLAVGQRQGVARVLRLVTDELGEAMSRAGAAAVADAASALPSDGERGLPVAGPYRLRKENLHASVSDPVMDTMNFLNEITLRYPEAISFAPGRPYDAFFDSDQVFTRIRRYLDHLAGQGESPRRIRDRLYQYGPAAGQIRELIAESLRADEDIDVPPESIVVTVGSQEAMLLTLRALMADPDDVLLVAGPCYVGITGAARLLEMDVVAVDERDDGLHPADVDHAVTAQRALGRRPRALYVVPDHSNPSGNTMPAETRKALLGLAARRDLLIVEDSPYRLVSPGGRLPTLKSLDRESRVVHLGSYSKTMFPGARLGFVVADQQVRDDFGGGGLLAAELAKIKSMVTVNTSSLSQAVVAGSLLASDGRVSELNAEAAAHYGRSLAAVLDELGHRFPADRRAALGIRWNRPSGGFFVTVQVSFPADNAALARSAEEFGVLWTPMAYFHPQGGGHHGIRLSTSYLTPADIREGIARFSRFIESETTRRQTCEP